MLREILNNAVEHGNRFDRTKRVLLKVRYEESILYLLYKMKVQVLIQRDMALMILSYVSAIGDMR